MKHSLPVIFTFLVTTAAAVGQEEVTLFGTVLTEQGRPVPDLVLTLLGPSTNTSVSTGTMGQYQIRDLAPGQYVVSIEDRAYKMTSKTYAYVKSGQNRFNIVLTPVKGRGSGVLTGTVRLPDGSPAPSLVVTVFGERTVLSVTTDPDGVYRVEGLHPGIYELGIGGESFAIASEARTYVDEGENRLDLTLGLHESVSVTAEAVEPTTVTNPGMSTIIVESRQIEDRLPSTVDLILRETPGLAVSRQGGVGSPSAVYIRGGAPNYALVLIDGFPVNDPGGEFDFGKLLPLELEQVEVTRGAASSVHGGALSGVVNMTTKRAGADERNLYVKGEGGNFSWNRFQGGTSGRTDLIDWNIGGLYLQTDNQEPNSAFSQIGVAGSFGAEIGEDTSFRAILRGETNDAGCTGADRVCPSRSRCQRGTEPSRSRGYHRPREWLRRSSNSG